jgi:hypothetical protein
MLATSSSTLEEGSVVRPESLLSTDIMSIWEAEAAEKLSPKGMFALFKDSLTMSKGGLGPKLKEKSKNKN